jgi:hypothetical protein
MVFECPHCGKSLAIDERGAGMMITCPDCQERVQVPGIADPEHQGPTSPPRSRVSPVGPDELDQLLSSNMDHMELIGQELAVIQDALDRIVSVIQVATSDLHRKG